jgi:hypothetical protein
MTSEGENEDENEQRNKTESQVGATSISETIMRDNNAGTRLESGGIRVRGGGGDEGEGRYSTSSSTATVCPVSILDSVALSPGTTTARTASHPACTTLTMDQ